MATEFNLATYPFDPTGRAATNKITGEQQIITGVTTSKYHFIVPKLAPFFGESLVVRYKDTNNVVRTLVEGVDYYLTHWFISASRACATPIYGSISFLDLQLTGVVTLDYQTIGGIWTQDDAKISEILAERLSNPRITAWDVVVDMPVSFPVIDHEWDLVDLVGASDVVASIDAIGVALRQTGETGITDHIANQSNPHAVTAAQVGLGLVRNLPTSDTITAQLGLSDDFYMTPKTTAAAVASQVGNTFNAHRQNTSNPHGTTAAQVGAYSRAETDLLLTNKISVGEAASDTLKVDGRSPIEYRDWVLEGTAANAVLFNGESYGDFVNLLLSSKVMDSERLDGRTFQEVVAAVSTQANANATTFDGRTFAEATAEILSGNAANALTFDGRTLAQAKAEILSGEAYNAARLDGLTFSEVKASVLTGKAADSALLDGRTYAQLVNDLSQTTVTNSLMFDGRTYTDVKNDILSTGVTNALTLDGHTYAEIAGAIANVVPNDSIRFSGYTLGEHTTYLETKFGTLDKTVTSAQFPANVEADEVANPEAWTYVAKVTTNLTGTAIARDQVWLVAGGEGVDELEGGVFLVSLSLQGVDPAVAEPRLNVTTLRGSAVGTTFELVASPLPSEQLLCLRSKSNRRGFTITTLSGSDSSLLDHTVPWVETLAPSTVLASSVAETFVTKTEYDAMVLSMEAAFDSLTAAFNEIKALVEA